MNLRIFLLRFTVFYVFFLGLGAFLLSVYKGQNNAMIGLAALLAATFFSCFIFGKRNGRFLDTREKWRAWVGILMIDFVVQCGLLALSVWLATSPLPYSLVALVEPICVLLAFHAPLVYLFMVLSGKVLVNKGIVQ